MAKPSQTSPNELDVTGYRCPMPVIRMESALRSLPDTAQLIVFTDDPVAAVDIPHACREAGHQCERLADRGEICVFRVTRAPNRQDLR